MAVLSDRDIRAAMQAGRVRIDPYDPACLQPSSVDLHLDADFRVFRNNRYPYIDSAQPQPDLTELVTIEGDEPFILHPERVRAWPDTRMGGAAGRSRRPPRGSELAWVDWGC